MQDRGKRKLREAVILLLYYLEEVLGMGLQYLSFGTLEEIEATTLLIIFSLYVDIHQCFLCEGGADMKLVPCGHVNMCHDCPRAMKCPDCRVWTNLVL